MRKTKKYSRFRMYAATTLLAFIIPTIFSIYFVLSNKQKYLNNIISNINSVSPINISISDIGISYKLELVLNNVKLYSKNSKSHFFYMDKASLRFNILRIFIKRDPLYLLENIDIDNAEFYPRLLDTSIFNKNNRNNLDDRNIYEKVKDIIHNISAILMDKSISIDNFSTIIIDNNDITKVSINSLNGDFKPYGYSLLYNINLPDKTLVNFSLESTTNLDSINTKIYAKDDGGDLFKYSLFATNLNDKRLDIILKNNDNKNLINAQYLNNVEKLSFNVTNIKITKDFIYKFIDIALDTPIINKFVNIDSKKISTLSNAINTLRDAKINANGSYSKEENLYINFDIDMRDKLFNLNVNAELTNNNLVLSNAYIDALEGNIIASGIVPLKDPIASLLSLNINNIDALGKDLSAKVTIKPYKTNDREIISHFVVSSLSYANTLNIPLEFDFIYKRLENEINLNLIKDKYMQSFKASASLNNKNPILVSAKGVIPQEIFLVLLGQNIIDNLSSLNVDYSISNALYTEGKGNIHRLNLYSRKIYTEEYLIKLSMEAYKNFIDINNIYYRLSENSGINANAKIEYDKDFNVKMNGNIDTPIGDYGLNGFITVSTNGNKIIYASTDKSEIVALGSVNTNGILDLNIRTLKELKINDIDINVDLSMNNYTQKPFYVYGNVKAKKNLSPIFAINTQFKLTNQSLAFTNIVVDYGENRISGDGILLSSDGIANFTVLLKDIENDGIFTIDTAINKNNIYGTIIVNKLPFNVKSKYTGLLTANASVIGLINDPVIYLNEFNIDELQAIGNRFDVSLTGYYRNGEVELKDVLINKTGKNGVVINQTISKKQQIKIPYAYISKDLQNVKVEFNNMFLLLSHFSGIIDYNMRKLPDGRQEYRLQTTTPLTINKRKLQDFGTVITYDGENMVFSNSKSHGISGSIMKENKDSKTDIVYVYDNNDLINIDGYIRNGKNDQVDLLVTSDILNVEIFEIFNALFTEIQSAPTNFIKDGNPYTLYAHIYGDANDVKIDGRFLGYGKKVKMSYFNDVFDNTVVDFNFNGNMFNINNLTFTSKNKKNLTITGEAEIFRNSINYMSFDLLSSDEQLGLLESNLNLGIAKVRGPVHIDIAVGGNIASPRIGGTLTLTKSDVQLSISSKNTYKEYVYGMVSRIYWDFLIEAWQQVKVSHSLVGDVYLEDGAKMRVYNTRIDGIELSGTVNVDRGTIYYLQNVYQLESGSATFPSVNSTDPIIEAQAYTYKKYYPATANYLSQYFESELSGESVTLYMEMNTRLSQLVSSSDTGVYPVRFYTIPSLGQHQVNQLAGIPQGSFGNREEQLYTESALNIGNTMNNNQLQQLTMNYSDLLLRSYVLRPVERWFRQFLGIDYINLSPSVINNLLFVTNNNNLSPTSVWDNTSVGIGKYVSKYLYIKYDVTYKVNDTSRPSINGRNVNPYYFDHQFGFEVDLLKNYKLANFVFEYKINPFDIQGKGQDFNTIIRWRF